MSLGVDINIKDDKGRTVVNEAIINNDSKLIELLLKYEDRIDFSSRDNEGNTYIHYIVAPLDCGSFENVNLLQHFSKYIDVNDANFAGVTPYCLALNQESNKMKKELEKIGVKSK